MAKTPSALARAPFTSSLPRKPRRKALGLALAGALLPFGLLACGGSAPPPAAAAQASAEPPPVEPALAAPAGNVPQQEPASAAPSDAAGAPPQQTTVEASAPERRQVTYRSFPDGLVVEVEGIRMTPHVESFVRKNGSYGVALSVDVTAGDSVAHHFLVSENGPLSVFARVRDPKGKVVFESGDKRSHGEALLLVPGMKTVFERRWPSDEPGNDVWYGYTLQLEVGLWGLGKVEADRRPLKRLFSVEMKAVGSPKPKVTPPSLR